MSVVDHSSQQRLDALSGGLAALLEGADNRHDVLELFLELAQALPVPEAAAAACRGAAAVGKLADHRSGEAEEILEAVRVAHEQLFAALGLPLEAAAAPDVVDELSERVPQPEQPVAAEEPQREQAVDGEEPADDEPEYGIEQDGELLEEFGREAAEHLDEIDTQLLTLEHNPRDSEALDAVFRAFHTIKGVAGFLGLADIETIAHTSESLLDQARQGEVKLSGEPLESVFRACDQLRELITGAGAEAAQPPIANNDDNSDGEQESNDAATRAQQDGGTTIRVPAARLDTLVDAVGELLIAEALVSRELTQLDLGSRGDTLKETISNLAKITSELHQVAMALRMVSLRALFRRLARLGRDVARRLNKNIDLVFEGHENELDRTIVATITDPLLHLLRNAIDHGIEQDELQRASAGKSARGRVRVSATHRGGFIYIEISDDGRGLDPRAILAKAGERLDVDVSAKLSEDAICNLIFEPGFSTAESVTEISGRGVGLDVVKRDVEGVRGAVEVTSRLGEGTTFRLRLPLTLAMIDGMVVRTAGQRFVVPTLGIRRLLDINPEHTAHILGRSRMLRDHDGLIPLYRLSEVLSMPADPTPRSSEAVLVVECDGKPHAFVVDEVIGQQQVVVKPLGDIVAGSPGLSGGAVMPDGQVGLILDVPGLVQATRQQAV